MFTTKIILLTLLFIQTTQCSLDERIQDKIEELRIRARRLYGPKDDQTQTRYRWSRELAYPGGGDRRTKHIISTLWLRYYSCCARLARSLVNGTRPAVSLVAYDGANVRIPCLLCVPPGESENVTWVYSQSLDDLTFEPLQEQPTIVTRDDLLTIYNVRGEHAGVYRCELGKAAGGLVALEVTDSNKEEYNVVKPVTSNGPYAAEPAVNAAIAVYSEWSRWSECSTCDYVGRRRRYGLCFVKNIWNTEWKSTNVFNESVCEQGKKLLAVFPKGIWCRSKYLPDCIRKMPAVQNRKSEIMLGLCKEKCEKRSNDVLTKDQLVKRLPPPVRDIIFGVAQEPITVRCPGTSLRDMPVSWQAGSQPIVPLTLDRATRGRIVINARDHLVFSTVQYGDDNLYSCWQGNALAGSVRLRVWAGPRVGPRLAALAYAVLTLLAASAARKLYRARRRRYDSSVLL